MWTNSHKVNKGISALTGKHKCEYNEEEKRKIRQF